MKVIIVIVCLAVLASTSYAQVRHVPEHRPPHRPSTQQITQTQTINNSSGPTIVIVLDDVFKSCKDGEDVYQRNINAQ
jgi:hypothetical protein